MSRRLPDRPRDGPRRVLLTNEDGLDAPGLAALAQAFAPLAEARVVAPLEDCSLASHGLSLVRTRELRIERRAWGDGVDAYGVDGLPGDCVLWALGALMRAAPPDLVVSGINRGANLADDWLMSGTVGAARLAAFLGVPAVAVSGPEDDVPGLLSAAARWTVELARSPWLRKMERRRYLTVSVPPRPPAEIRGVRLARRAERQLELAFDRRPSDEPGVEIWQGSSRERERPAPDRDVSLYRAGWIVVVPMRADEHDEAPFSGAPVLPDWSPGDPEKDPGCATPPPSGDDLR